jgi:hypothetical protein
MKKLAVRDLSESGGAFELRIIRRHRTVRFYPTATEELFRGWGAALSRERASAIGALKNF